MKMLDERKRTLEGMKPFRLVKYLSLSSLMVILVCTFVLSGFISQRAKAILLYKSEQYAMIVTENLNYQVFTQFTLPTVMTEGAVRLSRPNLYEKLDLIVRSAIHGFDVEHVNIYDPQQTLTYSTDKAQVGKSGNIPKAVFEKALNGESTSRLSYEGKTFLGFEFNSKARKLKTYSAMREDLGLVRGRTLGVFEITQDVTRDYDIIRKFQWIIMLSFLIFVGILFVTILFLARRAEGIISARFEERKKLEEQLHHSERLAALGEMIAGVSHEIRNPLGIIRSTAELLFSRMEIDRHKRLSSIIVEESTRLNDIVTEFLDFARPQSLRCSLCRLEDILDRNIAFFEAEFKRLDVEVVKNYQTDGYLVEVDENLLYRAFINLISNALQAMPDGGTLTLHTFIVNNKERLTMLELRISDTGPGIPEEVRKKIFNPFFTTREKGTGLGLAIVQSIIDGHHGDIEAESTAGRGASIVIRLPLVQPQYDTVE